jgi:FkbM family methyltransferase
MGFPKGCGASGVAPDSNNLIMPHAFTVLKTRLPLFPIWPAVAELDGVKVALKDSPLSPTMRRRLLKGYYETAERDLVQQFIQPGDQVLEIGASIGVLTCFLSRRAGAKGRIVSIEADPRLKPYFDANVALNGVKAEWIGALCCPVWAAEVPASVAKATFRTSDNNLSGRAGAGGAPIGVPAWTTAQTVCGQRQFEPTALVVDIEGAEAVWVEQSPRLPLSVRTVIAEFHPKITGASVAGQSIQRIVDEGFLIAGLRETVVAFRRGAS